MHKKIWSFLGSRNLSVFIFIAGLIYVLFLVGFGAVVPVWWVNNISTLLPFKVLYTAFFINLIICEIKWIPVMIRQCKVPKLPESETDFERFRHKIETQASKLKPQDLRRYLRWRGYKVQITEKRFSTQDRKPETGDQRGKAESSRLLHAYRGRFSPLGNILFHMAFLVLLAGVFVSVSYRLDESAVLIEGQGFGRAEAELGTTPPRTAGLMPGVGFSVEEIKPLFWKGMALFTDLTAHVTHGGISGTVSMSKPLSIKGSRITIQGIGYTPKYILRDMSRNLLDSGYVTLATFVSGSVDSFKIPGYPYKIYVSILPDFELKSGKIGTKSMNLNNPKYIVRVLRNKVTVYSGALGLNDEAYFDGLALAFPEIRYNGTFRIVRDPGEWLIWTAFVLMGFGLIWKLLFYRRELLLIEQAGNISLYLNSDYHSRIFFGRCRALLRIT